MSQIGVWFPHRLDSRPYDAVEKFFQNKHPIVSFKIMKQYLDRPFKSIFAHGHFIQGNRKKNSLEQFSTQNSCAFSSLAVFQHKRIGWCYNLQHNVLLVFFYFCLFNVTLMMTYSPQTWHLATPHRYLATMDLRSPLFWFFLVAVFDFLKEFGKIICTFCK